MVIDAERRPGAVGEKPTLKVHVLPALTVAPEHVPASSGNTDASRPPALRPLMVRFAVPKLVRVIVWAALEVPATLTSKTALGGDSLTPGPVAAPVHVAG